MRNLINRVTGVTGGRTSGARSANLARAMRGRARMTG